MGALFLLRSYTVYFVSVYTEQCVCKVRLNERSILVVKRLHSQSCPCYAECK